MNPGTEKISLISNLRFEAVEPVNDQFLKAKCYVLALGKNRNRTNFELDAVNRAHPSLSYIPVIGHLMCDEQGNYYLGSHDYKLDLETLTLKSQCVPFGVVLPSKEPIYEEVEEADGTIATYLVCEVILWTSRWPELTEAFYSNDYFTNQSMEINATNYKKMISDPNYTDVIDYSYSALCMLGKSDDHRFENTPCFPSASIVPITYSLDKDEFTSLMSELKEELNLYFSKDNSKQGGETVEEKLLILEKFNKTIEELDFSIDEMSVEELESKMSELFGESDSVSESTVEPIPEQVVNPESAPVDPETVETTVEPEPISDPELISEPEPVVETEPTPAEPVTFSATYREKRNALEEVLPRNVVLDADGNCVEETYCWIEDFSDEYVFVEMSHWTVTTYDCDYGRYAYTYDEATMTATLTSEFEKMVRVWLTLDEKAQLDAERANYELVKAEYAEYKENHSHEDAKVDELIAYRANVEAGKVFAKYENRIGETVEFKELKENVMNFSLADLEKECIYIVGLHAEELAKAESTQISQPLRFSIEEPVADETIVEDPYGDIRKRYLGR